MYRRIGGEYSGPAAHGVSFNQSRSTSSEEARFILFVPKPRDWAVKNCIGHAPNGKRAERADGQAPGEKHDGDILLEKI